VLPRCIGFMASLRAIINRRGNPMLEPPRSLLNVLIPSDATVEKHEEFMEEQATFIKDYLKNSTLVSQDRRGHVILCFRCRRALGYSYEGQYTIHLLTIPLQRLSNIEAAKCSFCGTRNLCRITGLVGSETICVTCVQKRWLSACCGYCDKV
jgi:hypothetical protein